MATAAKLEVVTENTASTDIVAVVTQNPGLVLLDSEKFDAFYTRMKAETDRLVPDTSTTKGRDEIRSMAARVVRSKTAIDKARLDLTKQWRDQTKLANEAGKDIEERMEALAVAVRKPLTEWEDAEKAREESAKALIAGIWAAAEVSIDDTADAVRSRGMQVWNTVLDPELLGARLDEAQSAKDIAVERLKVALARLVKEEADRAELEKLRAAEAERVRVEAEKAEADRVEAEIKAAQEFAARDAERRAQAEADKIVAAAKEAAELARKEAQDAADAERDRVAREHESELNAERNRTIEAERLAQAERDRVAEIERQREAREAADRAAAQKLADEQAEREKNKAHRTRIKTAAKQAIMTCGVSEDAAQKVVLAIIAGEIPAVTLGF